MITIKAKKLDIGLFAKEIGYIIALGPGSGINATYDSRNKKNFKMHIDLKPERPDIEMIEIAINILQKFQQKTGTITLDNPNTFENEVMAKLKERNASNKK